MSHIEANRNAGGNGSAEVSSPAKGSNGSGTPKDGGKLIVLTAPLTETIDHAGFFIQMGMASLPVWLEGVVLDRKYPEWRKVEYNPDGSARYMPAGVRLVQTSLEREFKRTTSPPATPTTSTSLSVPGREWWRSRPTTRWE